jgi:hypothetical protein
VAGELAAAPGVQLPGLGILVRARPGNPEPLRGTAGSARHLARQLVGRLAAGPWPPAARRRPGERAGDAVDAGLDARR